MNVSSRLVLPNAIISDEWLLIFYIISFCTVWPLTSTSGPLDVMFLVVKFYKGKSSNLMPCTQGNTKMTYTHPACQTYTQTTMLTYQISTIPLRGNTSLAKNAMQISWHTHDIHWWTSSTWVATYRWTPHNPSTYDVSLMPSSLLFLPISNFMPKCSIRPNSSHAHRPFLHCISYDYLSSPI